MDEGRPGRTERESTVDVLFPVEVPVALTGVRHSSSAAGVTGWSEFDRLRAHLDREPGVRGELEAALQLLIDRVDPADRGARFVVGTAVEWMVAATAWSAGVLVSPGGHSVDGFDLQAIEEQARGLWSVKSSFQKAGAAFRITNGLGGAGRGLTDPTLFLHPRLPGIVLVHPDLHPDVAAEVVGTPDSTVLAFRHVLGQATARPECVIPLRMPVNEHRGKEDPALLFTKALLAPDRFPRLNKVFAAAERSTGSVVGEMTKLVALRDSGAISQDDYEQLKNRLISG